MNTVAGIINMSVHAVCRTSCMVYLIYSAKFWDQKMRSTILFHILLRSWYGFHLSDILKVVNHYKPLLIIALSLKNLH